MVFFISMQVELLLLGMKWVFKHHDLQKFGLKLKLKVIFTHLKLCVAVARHNFKWVKKWII